MAWVTDIRTAIQLGKEHNRPIFLYTGNGRDQHTSMLRRRLWAESGALSDGRVIDVLNHQFVCAYTVNEDYLPPRPTVGPVERAELERIQQEGFAKKLPVGTVRVYDTRPFKVAVQTVQPSPR